MRIQGVQDSRVRVEDVRASGSRFQDSEVGVKVRGFKDVWV